MLKEPYGRLSGGTCYEEDEDYCEHFIVLCDGGGFCSGGFDGGWFGGSICGGFDGSGCDGGFGARVPF